MIDPKRTFLFSQSNLQDFDECRKRFFLKYIQKLAWPAAESEPIMENEKWMRQGTAFHTMAHQYFLGIPEGLLSRQASSEPIGSWWTNFLARATTMAGLADKESKRHPEFTLLAHLGEYSITAKFDLLLIMPDTSIVIYDWKTARHHPKRSTLESRLQTLVYPVVAYLCSPELLNSPSGYPSRVTMIYWFAEFPDQPEVFVFDSQMIEKSREKLEIIVETIAQLIPEGVDCFPLASDEQTCTYCNYRSLCDRGSHGGSFFVYDEEREIPELTLELEQIGEIEF